LIAIPRSLIRRARAIFRVIARRSTVMQPVVSFHAASDGLRIRLHKADIDVEFHRPGSHSKEVIALPLNALADFEGRDDGPVALESAQGKVFARWQDGALPRETEYPAEDVPPFPGMPTKMLSVEENLRKALTDATGSADQTASRYALNHLLLRGRTGEIVATDGRQLLVQNGFQFGWSDDVLIPASPVVGHRELANETASAIGRGEKHVALRIGAWTFWLPINKEGRFPRYEVVFPRKLGSASRMQLDPLDATFLEHALSRLPGADEDSKPVTLDLNTPPVIRAKAYGQSQTTEVVLARSKSSGAPVRLSLNRRYLERAVKLGFRECLVVNADTPIVCQDANRKLIIMLLDNKSALSPSEDAIRVVSDQQQPAAAPTARTRRPSIVNEAPKPRVVRPTEQVPPNSPSDPGAGIVVDLVTEAQALRDMLHAGFTRAARLVAALKRQRRQDQLLKSTLSSLRQLDKVAQ
jgi:hypothetical protein